MDRRTFLKRSGLTALLPLWPRPLANKSFRRRRPSDADWPSKTAWKRLNDEVDGNLIPLEFPIEACIKDSESAACRNLIANLKNPYFVGDQPGLTQTLGWVDAWFTRPSVFAVAARNADHVSAAVRFARENNLRLVVKGGGHSYQGTSNAADSLLIWTRHMHDITRRERFIPQGCVGKQAPQRAVTSGSRTIWIEAYDAVTTKGGVRSGRRLHDGRSCRAGRERWLWEFFETLRNRGCGFTRSRGCDRRRKNPHRKPLYEFGSILGAQGRWRRHVRGCNQSDSAGARASGVLGRRDFCREGCLR